jgi:hypothetical protein
MSVNVFRSDRVVNQRPRVTHLVMYKHGVAFLERSGPADGIAEQLDVLRDAGPEGEVRARTVDQLVALQDRAAALDADIRHERDRADAENRAAATELDRVIAGGVS